MRAFRQGLKETGYIEGQNVAVEYHSAGGDPDRLRSLVTDLIRRRVAAIAGNTVAMQAAKAATTTIPIVFFTGGDPVEAGLVASLNRPGGNITGISFLGAALGAKRLELLRKLVPNATTIGLLANPSPDAEWERRDVQAAAQAVGQQLIIVYASSAATSREPSGRSFNAELVQCSRQHRRLHDQLIGNESSRWRQSMRCRQAMPYARPSRPVV